MRDNVIIWEQYSTNIRKNLDERGVDFNRVSVWVDERNDTATFPIYNLSGQMVGYQFYNPAGKKYIKRREEVDRHLFKYYTFLSGKKFEKHMGVWGLESYDLQSKFLFIVEGIFDAIKIQNAGYSAIATLSNDPRRDLKRWLSTLPQTIVAILDNDIESRAGNKLAKFANIVATVPEPYNDLGDMPQSEVNEFIQNVLTKYSNE